MASVYCRVVRKSRLRDRIRSRVSNLNIKVGFGARIILVIFTAVDLNMGQSRSDGIGAVLLEESLME
jgi:hypothetical protein